ncbi:hypothetical protein Cgig2_010738 [Carnegiea gigantea]|uniref:Uncharacterized protein n=1 Tax=Carnegiea gigantea TaxID=171969 RepID=A0A9Q1QMC6_9CARY|nr:hypothetical protein Cgig2_010738 [Carnegiea gigantea]
MFESNSNVNSHPPMQQTSPPNHFSNITDHYHHQNPSHAYLNFPSHLLDDDELFLGTVLPYSSPLPPIAPPLPPPHPPAPTTTNNCTSRDLGEQKAKEKGKRKRPVGRVAGSGGGGGGGGGGECGGGSGGKTKRRRGKTDRHSKIHTAKGPRDRRMRLSLQIARKFFDLQDMLGFDKASKTIEWLFNKSKAAIKDLAERSCTSTAMASSSPSSDQDINVRHQGNNDDDVSVKDKKNKGKKGALLFQAMRENREKARARARERTKEKLLMMQKQGNDQNPNAGSSSSSTKIRGDQMVPSSSCDLIMASNEINFASFPANWVTQDMNMGSNHIQVQNPNRGFIGRPYNQGN